MIGVLLTDCVINVFETLGYVFDRRQGDLSVTIQYVSHFLVYAGICILTIFVAMHFGRMIEVRGLRVAKEVTVTIVISVINLAGVVASRFFGFYYSINENHHYIKLSSYPVYIVGCLLAVIPLITMVLKGRKVLRRKEFIAFILFAILSTIGGVMQLIVPQMALFNTANSISILIVILIHELEYSVDTVRNEKMLAMARIHAYESQIQPHFIYNSLTAIRSQLPPDSEAVDTLNHFAGFLRGTIDVMNEDKCISFAQEMKTVEHYLFLEKTRFGDKLQVEKDIKNEDFELPAFTIQLLVENAIRHGIRQKPDGRGTVTISSYLTREAHVIEISDDGVGFDAGQPGEEDTHHSIGLINLRKRLELMCGGELIIESVIGKGTQAWVRIPLR